MPTLTGLARRPDWIHTLDEIQVIHVVRRMLDTDQHQGFVASMRMRPFQRRRFFNADSMFRQGTASNT